MVDFGALTKKLVANAIMNRIPGLSSLIGIEFYIGETNYDPAADTALPQYTSVSNIVCVESGITMEDVSAYNTTAKSRKLLIPGVSVPQVPRSDVDKAILEGKEWNITKVKQVPGGSLLIIFIDET